MRTLDRIISSGIFSPEDFHTLISVRDQLAEAKAVLREAAEIVQEFAIENAVSCPEATAQTDSVFENAPELLEKLCNLFGYFDHDTEGVKDVDCRLAKILEGR